MNISKTIIIGPSWGEIENARNQVSRFLIDNDMHEELVQAVTMIVSELIENGIK